MKGLFQQLSNLLRDEEGATLVEYAIVLVAIAVVCIVAVESIGGSANNMYESAAQPGVWNP